MFSFQLRRVANQIQMPKKLIYDIADPASEPLRKVPDTFVPTGFMWEQYRYDAYDYEQGYRYTDWDLFIQDVIENVAPWNEDASKIKNVSTVPQLQKILTAIFEDDDYGTGMVVSEYLYSVAPDFDSSLLNKKEGLPVFNPGMITLYRIPQ